MALLGNIGLPTLISFPCRQIHISNISCTRKTKIKNNKVCRQVHVTANKYQLDHRNEDFSQLHFPVDFYTDYERKLEDVRDLLVESRNNVDDQIDSLIFVDAIQRLGIDRHYDEEIHAILKQHHLETSDKIYGFHSLHDIALSFRLLRQRGYNVSADVFNNFKGEDGMFKVELKQSMKGLMQLYEATHLSFEGENILDEAEVFSKQHLSKHLATNNNNNNNMDDDNFSNIVRMRLRHPVHKSITWMDGVNDLPSRDLVGGMDIAVLGELANMALLIRQSVYHKELLQISKWWDDLGLTKELELARNQPIKWYTWSMSMLLDISLSDQRVQLSKSIAFIYLIDDIFDLYGTPDELGIFTEAVGKWDYASMLTLPEYMKTLYKALLDTTNEIGRTICEKYGCNPITTLKQTWKDLCNAFLVEAKWFASGECPRAEDYLATGKVSSGVHVVLVHLFYLLDEGPVHLDDTSTLISSVAAILRLWDDFGSAEDEHQNGNDGSYMECYMRDHNNDLTHTQTREHMMNMIASEWKRLNKECFHLSRHSLPFQEASLNLARMVPLMYDYDDNKRLPILEKLVKFVSSPTSIDNLRHTRE